MNKLKDKQEYLQNENLDMENIVKEYTSFLNSIINNKVNNTLSLEDKEEILTDAFFILWKNQEKVTSIKTYLVGVVNNLIKEKFKKNKIPAIITIPSNTENLKYGQNRIKEMVQKAVGIEINFKESNS